MNKDKRVGSNNVYTNKGCSVYCLKNDIHIDGNISRFLNCNSIYALENGKKIKLGMTCDADCEILKNIVKKKYPPIPKNESISISLFDVNSGIFQGYIKYTHINTDNLPISSHTAASISNNQHSYSFLETPRKKANDTNKGNYQYKMGEFTICDNLWQGTPNNIFQLIKEYDGSSKIQSLLKTFKVENVDTRMHSDYVHFNVPYYIYIDIKKDDMSIPPVSRIYLKKEDGKIGMVNHKKDATQWIFFNADRDTYNSIKNTTITFNKRFYISVYPFKEHVGKFLRWNNEGNFEYVINPEAASTFCIPSLDSNKLEHNEECNDCVFQDRDHDTTVNNNNSINNRININIDKYNKSNYATIYKKKYKEGQFSGKATENGDMINDINLSTSVLVTPTSNHINSIDNENISNYSRRRTILKKKESIDEKESLENDKSTSLEEKRLTTSEGLEIHSKKNFLLSQLESRPITAGVSIFIVSALVVAGIIGAITLFRKKKKNNSDKNNINQNIRIPTSSINSSMLKPATIFTSKIKTKNAYFPSFTLHTPKSNMSSL